MTRDARRETQNAIKLGARDDGGRGPVALNHESAPEWRDHRRDPSLTRSNTDAWPQRYRRQVPSCRLYLRLRSAHDLHQIFSP